MTTYNLSLSDVISVSVLSAPSGLGMPNVNTIALFTVEQPVTPYTGDYKLYKSSTDVAADFSIGSECIAHATAIFSQNPNIMTTNGYLAIIPLQTINAELETVQAAIVRTLNQIYYFGISTTQALTAGADLTALCAYMQSIDKVMALTSATAADLEISGLFDIVRQAGQDHIRCIYHSTSAAIAREFGSGYLARALSTDFTGSNTASTMHLKEIIGFTSDPTIDETLLAKAQYCGADVYGAFGGYPKLFTSGANGFFDSVYNALWFKIAIQITGFNILAQTNTKIPQTEPGMLSIKGAYTIICNQAVTCGYVAAGTWTSPDTFGNRNDFLRNIKDFGFYIYSAPVSSQSAEDRAARKTPICQIALKEAGAIHSGSIIVNINA